jgi:AcrR family transcriptional regulator
MGGAGGLAGIVERAPLRLEHQRARPDRLETRCLKNESWCCTIIHVDRSEGSGPARLGVRKRTAAAILDAAAQVFAEDGAQPSLSEVAARAEVSRATLYRYFPTRRALLDELARVALRETGDRLSAANLENVSMGEGVTRIVRALVTVGDQYVVLAREHVQPDPDDFERRLAAPIRALLERGQRSGEIRADVPAAWLTESLVGLVASALVSAGSFGTEDTIDAVTALFLHGAGRSAIE